MMKFSRHFLSQQDTRKYELFAAVRERQIGL
jgi:hypothetical protein